jgi:HK97 family phage major capsid protein
MAITAPTATSDFSGFVPADQAAPIFEQAARMSAVQQLVQRVPLGLTGTNIPVITGRPAAGWVDEGGTKPASAGSMTLKSITPKKLAAIMVVSAEVARLNPAQFVDRMTASFAETFAVSFDLAALHDQGPDGSAGAGPFSTFIDQTTKAVEIGGSSQALGGIHGDFVSALDLLVSDTDASGRRYKCNGFAIDSVLEPNLWGATDSTGQPLYTDLPTGDIDAMTQGRLLGRPAYIRDTIATSNLSTVVGYAGDWSQAAWGAIGGISYRISTEATVTINGSLTSLFEKNLVAILAEAEYGFVVNDADAFVRLTNATGS